MAVTTNLKPNTNSSGKLKTKIINLNLIRFFADIYLFITISGIQHMVNKKKKKKSRQAMRIIRKRVEDSIHDRSPDLDAI